MMFCRRYRNNWIAYCFATESDGAVLVRDIWFFNPEYYGSVVRCWKQICEWNALFGRDPNFKWDIARRPSNM